MTTGCARRAQGFTLIEVLVALAIVAIGMSAVLEAVGSSADTASYLQEKTLAEWIALNQLATTRLQVQPPAKGTSDGELDYAGRHWRWHQEVMDGGFPGILQIDVTVQEADTARGKDAPWIGSVSGAYGDAVAQPQSTSLYQEYQPLQPGAGGAGDLASPPAQAPSTNASPFGGLAPGGR
ncbi:MAG: type II secretion system minor pseudopilin GspI [Steroidobacteraceae bacterium]